MTPRAQNRIQPVDPTHQNRPAVSFLCTAYRTERQVEQTIASVLAQTSPDWELVVVDNGPSDEMAEIVGRYTHDPRIRLVRQVNSGVSGGVDGAAAAARGRYLAVLHSDDLVLPGFCERLVGVLDARPEVTAVACDAYLFHDDDATRLPRTYLRMAGAPRPDETHHVTLAELIDGVCPYYTGLVRREAWHAVGGYATDVPTVGDLDLWMRLVAAGHTLVEIPDVLGLYRHAAESMSRGAHAVTRIEAARIDLVTRFATASGRPEDLRALDRALRRSRQRVAVVRARIALAEGDLAAARRHAGAALAERATARATAILVGLTVAPRVVGRAHAAKQRLVRRLHRLHGVTVPLVSPSLDRPDAGATSR